MTVAKNSEDYLSHYYWHKDTNLTPWLGQGTTYNGQITSEYAGDNSDPTATELDDATVEALAAAKKIIIKPPNGTVALELRIRSDGSTNDENILQIYASAGVDHYAKISQLVCIQGTQIDTTGIYFADDITESENDWITSTGVVQPATAANSIARYTFNTHGYDRFLIVASDRVTTTVYVDWKVM